MNVPNIHPKHKSGDHIRDTRLVGGEGEDFDGCCDIQSPTYKQRGPMKNKIGKYSGDVTAKEKY